MSGSGEGRPGGSRAEGADQIASPLLEVRDLAVSFSARAGLISRAMGKTVPEVRAVDGVTFALASGEILALAGESGCGKTTTARAIMGLQEARHGEIRFEDQPIGGGEGQKRHKQRSLRSYRRRVQMIVQDPTGALNPRQTIYEFVAEGLRIHNLPGDEKQLVARALSRSGLRPPERFFLLYPHEVSGGQRQRVVIAGTLVVDPEVIVADEPVSSLDASVRGEILALLLRLREELNLAILVITHDLGLAWNIADRVAVMYLGRIVEIGPTDRILKEPLHPYTKALLSVVPEAQGLEPQILRGEPPDPGAIPQGCRFHPRCPLVESGRAAAEGIEERCRHEDLGLSEVEPGREVACHLLAAGRAVSDERT